MADNFDVLREMSNRNLDIRGFNLWENLTNCNRGKRRATVTLTVDDQTAQEILGQAMGYKDCKRHYSLLLFYDAEQFDQVKKELEQRGADESAGASAG